jgi:hypothetical protein
LLPLLLERLGDRADFPRPALDDEYLAALKVVREKGEPAVLAAYFKGDLSGLEGTEVPEVLPFSQVVRTARRKFPPGMTGWREVARVPS